MVFQVCLATQEDKVLRAQLVSLASLEPMVRREEGVLLVKQAHEDKEDQRVLVVEEVPEVQQENLEQREQQEMMDQLVAQEREDSKDLRALLDWQALKDHLGLLERMDCPVTLDSEERLVSKERLDLLDLEVLLAHRALQEKLDLLEREDILDHQGPLESKVFPELLAKKVERVIQVLRGFLGNLALPD